MRVFLSYSSVQDELATRVELSLLQDGHSVFLDRSVLEAAEAFDRAIRRELRGSDVVVFLLDERALQPGSYVLTELELARKRWRNPAGRVLPVAIGGLPVESVPPYLRGVTVLEPQGDVAAEVAAAIESLAGRRQRSWVRWVAVAALAGGVPLAGWYVGQRSEAGPRLVSGSKLEALGWTAGEGQRFLVSAVLRNPTPDPFQVAALTLESGGRGEYGLPSSLEGCRWEPEAAFEPFSLAPGASKAVHLELRPVTAVGQGIGELDLSSTRWRLRVERRPGAAHRTEWRAFEVEGEREYPLLRPLPLRIRGRARTAMRASGFGRGGDAWLVLADPWTAQHTSFGAEGMASDRSVRLGLEPLFANEELEVVATRDRLHALYGYSYPSSHDWRTIDFFKFQTIYRLEASEPPPRLALEVGGDLLVSLSTGTVRVAGLRGFSPDPEWTRVNADDLPRFDLTCDGWARAADGGEPVLGRLYWQAGSSRLSMEQAPPSDAKRFECATTMAVYGLRLSTFEVVALDCESKLVAGGFWGDWVRDEHGRARSPLGEPRVFRIRELASLPAPPGGGVWPLQRLAVHAPGSYASASEPDRILLALGGDAAAGVGRVSLFLVSPGGLGEPSSDSLRAPLAEFSGWEVVSLATVGGWGIVVLRDAEGRHEALQVLYGPAEPDE